MKKCGSTKILLSNDLAAPTQVLKTVTLRVLLIDATPGSQVWFDYSNQYKHLKEFWDTQFTCNLENMIMRQNLVQG